MALLDLFRRRPAKPTGLPRPARCDFIAIDFETANETRGSACSVGVTQVRDGRVVAEGLTLINPETYFNPYCSAVNGITDLASPQNSFAGGEWNYLLNPNAIFTDKIVINEMLERFFNTYDPEELMARDALP